MKSQPIKLPPAVLEGPILSNRPASVTTIWRDGEVVRTDAWGRSMVMPAIAPVRENTKPKGKTS